MRDSTSSLQRLFVCALLAAVAAGLALHVSSLSAQDGTSIRQGPETTIGPRPEPTIRQGPELAITGPRPCDADPVPTTRPELRRLVRDLDRRIAGTERDMQKLGFKSSIKELDDWEKLAADERQEVIKKAAKDLGGVAIGQFIKGIQASGVASITPWSNATSVINRLKANGIDNPDALAAVQKAFESARFRSLVRRVALVPDKPIKLDQLEYLLTGLKDIVFDDADIATHPDQLTPILKGIVTIGQLAVPAINPVAAVFLDEIWVLAPTVYFGGSSAVTSLTNGTEKQLNALKLAACDQKRFYETRRGAETQLAGLGLEKQGPNVGKIVGVAGAAAGAGIGTLYGINKLSELIDNAGTGGGSNKGGSCTPTTAACTTSSNCSCGWRCVNFDGSRGGGFCSP
jgi:hypothetical protein